MYSNTSILIAGIMLLCLMQCVSGCSKEVTGPESGSLIITVLDGNSATITGALVIVGSDIIYISPPKPPDIPQHSRTNQAGVIEFPRIITGEHQISVQAVGFEQYDASLRILANRTFNHLATLTPDSTSLLIPF